MKCIIILFCGLHLQLETQNILYSKMFSYFYYISYKYKNCYKFTISQFIHQLNNTTTNN